MEETHRLKVMIDDYDVTVFNQLFKETASLRKKLAYGIDARIFGVDYNEILSWFDVKFIYAFNKYYHSQPERLKGYIISSLQTYKLRVIKTAYQEKMQIHKTTNFENLYSYEGFLNDGYSDENGEIVTITHPSEDPAEVEKSNLQRILDYLQGKLSEDAFFVLELELFPPLYILDKTFIDKKERHKQITPKLIAEYLGLDDVAGVNYIKACKEEIKDCYAEYKDELLALKH